MKDKEGKYTIIVNQCWWAISMENLSIVIQQLCLLQDDVLHLFKDNVLLKRLPLCVFLKRTCLSNFCRIFPVRILQLIILHSSSSYNQFYLFLSYIATPVRVHGNTKKLYMAASSESDISGSPLYEPKSQKQKANWKSGTRIVFQTSDQNM